MNRLCIRSWTFLFTCNFSDRFGTFFVPCGAMKERNVGNPPEPGRRGIAHIGAQSHKEEQTEIFHRVPNMSAPLILASGSEIRATLLANARLDFEVLPARIDESALRAGLEAEEATPRDVADALAEYKARKVGGKRPEALVLGCDQVAAFKGTILSKPETPEVACEQLALLSGQTHHLMSAAVIYHHNEPIWRHVGLVRMTMRSLSAGYIESYVARNWDSIRHSVGAYKLEEEGVRLFTQIEGSYFNVLGLPLTELISYLILKGDLES